jgi:SAM-dependent methyltransferase
VTASSSCEACGGSALVAHFSVAGSAGPDGLIPSSDRYGTALADIVRCRDCGHMQLARFPAEADLSQAYEEAVSEDYVDEEAGQRATARAVLTAIERHVAAGSLLDLGCWVGFLLDEARRRGWNVAGVEPSEFAARYARERLGLDVLEGGLFETELEPASFDAIVMADVIEHLPRAGEALDRVADLLAPGGVVALALPDAGSRLARAMGRRWWSVLPTHVHYFTRHSMRTLLAVHGFETLSLTTAPKTFTLGYYLSRLGGYRAGIVKPLVGGARALGVAERLVTPDFRDRMLVIACPSPSPTEP